MTGFRIVSIAVCNKRAMHAMQIEDSGRHLGSGYSNVAEVILANN